MNLFVLFGDGAITRKKNDGNFASCSFRHFFRVILHLKQKEMHSLIKQEQFYYHFLLESL
jgi:hypothetical protein